MTFIDTSVLAACYCPEPLSAVAQAALEETESRALSWLVEAELASVFARKVRTREITAVGGNRAATSFKQHLASGLYFRQPVVQAHFEQVVSWLSDFDLALQTLDALHLAVAFGLDAELLTSDAGQAKAALKVGVPVRLLSREGRSH